MSIVSVKDFGIALNISGGTIRSKISRKQLLRNRKGLIDTENPKNYAYLIEVNGGDQSVFDKYHIGVVSVTKVNKKTTNANKILLNVENKPKEVVLSKKEVAISENLDLEEVNDNKGSVNIAPTVETKKRDSKKIEEKLSAEEKRIISEQKKTNALLLSFDIRKKEAEVVLKEREAELKQYELEKKAGNTLPLDMIENIIGINYKAVLKSCIAQTKNIAVVMVNQLGGSKEDLASIIIELENVFEGIVKDSARKADVDIQKMIEEYSEVRSRGERKA